MSLPQPSSVDIKRSIASSYPDFEARATTAWHEIIDELDKVAKVIKEEGVNVSRWLLEYSWWNVYIYPWTVHSSDQLQLARQYFPKWDWKYQKAWNCFDKRCSRRRPGSWVERWLEEVRQGERWAGSRSRRYSRFELIYKSLLIMQTRHSG